MLAEEYHVSPETAPWFTPAVHHWDDAGETEQIRPRNGSIIRMLEGKGRDPNEALQAALVTGELDAIAVAGPAGPFAPFPEGDIRFRRLFENVQETEIAYFNKTGIFPIIHLLVARRSAVDRCPELPQKLFELFVRSKRTGRESIGGKTSFSTVWKDLPVEEERDIFQADPLVYGLARNRHSLEKFLQYCFEQGISGRWLEPEELFMPNTWELEEEHF
jgi:4,5-dihydroxyphthalate decarboxylase